MCVSRHAQNTQNKKFAYYAIFPEKHGAEVVLLPADKYESFLQGDSILDMFNQACPKYSK